MNWFCRTAFIGILLTVVLQDGALADLVTIDFDSFTPTTSFNNGVEDGFLVQSLFGPIAVSGQYLGPNSGNNSIHHQSPGLAVFSIVHAAGELFELESFYAGSTFGNQQPVTVWGLNGSSIVGSATFTPTLNTYTQITIPSLQNQLVDQLIFRLGNVQIGPAHIDDIVLETTSIPEPQTAFFAFGLVSALLLRRRPRSLATA